MKLSIKDFHKSPPLLKSENKQSNALQSASIESKKNVDYIRADVLCPTLCQEDIEFSRVNNLELRVIEEFYNNSAYDYLGHTRENIPVFTIIKDCSEEQYLDMLVYGNGLPLDPRRIEDTIADSLLSQESYSKLCKEDKEFILNNNIQLEYDDTYKNKTKYVYLGHDQIGPIFMTTDNDFPNRLVTDDGIPLNTI